MYMAYFAFAHMLVCVSVDAGLVPRETCFKSFGIGHLTVRSQHDIAGNWPESSEKTCALNHWALSKIPRITIEIQVMYYFDWSPVNSNKTWASWEIIWSSTN